MLRFQQIARDNVYNNENDFSDVFTWSIWTREDDSDDWAWNRETAYVAICRHLGGDVRGNYGPVSLHRVDDSIGDCGFLDWVLGWNVHRSTALTDVDVEDLDDITADTIVAAAEPDEDLTERCSPGYASLPSSELWDETKTDRCYWYQGAAIIRLADRSGWLVAQPYHYHADATSGDGLGYLCDAQIDTDSFIAATIGEDIIGDLDKQAERLPLLDDLVQEAEWDHDDAVGKLCEADHLLSEWGAI